MLHIRALPSVDSEQQHCQAPSPPMATKHWLLQDPADFLNRYERTHRSTHHALGLTLCFIVRHELQFLRERHADGEPLSGPSTTFSEIILFPLDKRGQRYNSAAAQRTIVDIVIEMLEVMVVDECRDVQFADFACDKPVVLSATASELSIAIVMTLGRASKNQTVNFRRLNFQQSSWMVAGLADHRELQRLHRTGAFAIPGGARGIDAIFMQYSRSIPAESAEDDYIRALCASNLTAIIAVERKRTSCLGEPQPLHGLVTVNMTDLYGGTFIFTVPDELGGRIATTTLVHERVRYWVAARLDAGVIRLREKFDMGMDRMHAMFASGRADVQWRQPHDGTVYDGLAQRRILWHDEEQVWQIPKIASPKLEVPDEIRRLLAELDMEREVEAAQEALSEGSLDMGQCSQSISGVESECEERGDGAGEGEANDVDKGNDGEESVASEYMSFPPSP